MVCFIAVFWFLLEFPCILFKLKFFVSAADFMLVPKADCKVPCCAISKKKKKEKKSASAVVVDAPYLHGKNKAERRKAILCMWLQMIMLVTWLFLIMSLKLKFPINRKKKVKKKREKLYIVRGLFIFEVFCCLFLVSFQFILTYPIWWIGCIIMYCCEIIMWYIHQLLVVFSWLVGTGKLSEFRTGKKYRSDTGTQQ